MDWPAMIAIGLGRLRLDPESFWTLSPREFVALVDVLTPGARTTPCGRETFASLAARYPDDNAGS